MPSVSLSEHPFRIRPNETVDLAARSTRADHFFPESKEEGEVLFKTLEKRIDELQEQLYAEGKHRLLVIFQAMDTGGKDGVIRGVFDKMDPQGLRVAAFKRPSPEELAHDYLWRVHRQVPGNGETVIFNRSHYEDIIAVGVRNIFPKEIWQRRYRHIVEFEQMLADEGTTIVKFFLHISREEQKKRLQARLDDPAKHWKFNPGDLDDRALWSKFMAAYDELLPLTSTAAAPWYVIPADSKRRRDLAVAQIMVATLEGLGMKYPPVDFDPAAMVIPD
jgi:PPK2 family polyphosphate:nucleotide phosphotransferase